MLHGGNIRGAIRKYKLAAKDIIDFSASINPLGFPQSLKKIILDNLSIIPNYPDPDCSVLKDSLSQYLGIAKNNLLIGNGSIELIYLIAFALKPKRALILTPTFSEYERAVLLSGGKCLFSKTSEENCFEIKINSILRNLKDIDLVFICNPNNPTGFLLKKEPLMALVKECEKKRVALVVDEVFMDFVEEKDKASLLKSALRSKHVLVLQSLTKFFAISGLRLGFIVGEKGLIQRISSYQPPWSVNSLAQLAGARIINDSHFIKKSRQYLFERRRELFDDLKGISYLNPYPPSANFIFSKITDDRLTSAQLCDYCGKKGMLIRDCSNFRGLDNSFIRIAVRKKEENKQLIKVLKEIYIAY